MIIVALWTAIVPFSLRKFYKRGFSILYSREKSISGCCSFHETTNCFIFV